MKINFLTNRINNLPALNQGLVILKQRLDLIGFPFEYTVQPIDVNFTTIAIQGDHTNGTPDNGYMIDPAQIEKFSNNTDLPFLIFNTKGIVNPPLNPVSEMTGKITAQMSEQWYNDFPNVFADFVAHELCHIYAFKAHAQDLTHYQYQNPAFSQKQNWEWYNYLLLGFKSFWGTPVASQPYKWFKLTESTGGGHTVADLKPELVKLLDTARGIANTAFIIGSGFRTPEQNKLAGGAINSSHLKGLGADLRCSDNATRTKILKGLLNCGTDCFIEICGKHIHVDVDSGIHPMGNTMWSPDTD